MREINIGVAVSLAEGLIVPTIRRADEKPLAQIARESHDLAIKAREGERPMMKSPGDVHHYQPWALWD